MNDVIFNNEIKVTVVQNPEIAEDGDTVEFSATPQLLFATENRTGIDNYSFTYTWMVSYDGGLSYKKTGTNTDKLVLENINTKVFNNSIYKVKVVLEDLEDFLLAENGDRILTQIGEILLFNNNNTALSIQSDVVTNDTSVTSVNNSSDTSNAPLNFLNIEGTVNEALVFDNTITQDIQAEIISLQSKIAMDNQAKSIDGEIIIDVNLPSTPNTEIVLPSEILGIQANCYIAVKKKIGNDPYIQYEVCETGGAAGLFTNCSSSSNFNTLAECQADGRCGSDSELVCEGYYDTGVLEKAQFNNIKFENCIGNCSCCCDSVENICDTTNIWDKCEEIYGNELPPFPGFTDSSGNTFIKRNYVPPCGSAINCVTEEYIPNSPIPKYFIANNCSATEGWVPSNPGATVINTAEDKKNYCNARCRGEAVIENIPGLSLSLSSWLSYLFYQVHSVGGLLYGDIFVRTYCNGEGQKNGSMTGIAELPIIKKCTLKVCKQKWVGRGRTDNYSVSGGTETGAHFEFSRVKKDAGPSITVDGVELKSDLLVAPNSSHIRNDNAPPYKCYVDGTLEPDGSILFAQEFGPAPDELLQKCEWGVVKKCCPVGKNCTYKVDEGHKQLYPKGNYPEFTLDATNKTFDRRKLYTINRSLALDFIQGNSCKAVCDGEGCEIFEKWSILSIDPIKVPCNEDFDIFTLDEISHGGHAQNGSEIVVATDAKCVQDPTPAKRTIKIAKIVKRYTYKKPGDEASYDKVLLQVYSQLGYTLANDGLYSAFLITYEEQPVNLDLSNIPTNNPYIKLVKTFDDGGLYPYIDPTDGKKKTKKKPNPLYRHSKIVLTGTTPLMRVNCDKCKPIYYVSSAQKSDYPCNDALYRIPGCVDANGDPLPYAYGNCLKYSSDKKTPIKIVTVSEIKEPTDDMFKQLGKPNTDFFRTPGEAKAEGTKRVGSTGIVCSAT